MSQTRFKLGDVVRWTALAARVLCDETATVVDVHADIDGVESMDQYTVITNSGQTGIFFAAELESVPTAQLRPTTTVWHRHTSAAQR